MANNPALKDEPTDARVLEQEYEPEFPIGMLSLHPRNPNQGDVGALMESFAVKGFYGAVVRQKSSGFVIAGNHRVMAAEALGLAAIPVLTVDVDDETADRILVGDNRHARLGQDDDVALAELLSGIAQTEIGLAGTGFDGDDLDALLYEINKDDRPDGDKKKREKSHSIVVRCADEREQNETLQKLLVMGLDARAR